MIWALLDPIDDLPVCAEDTLSNNEYLGTHPNALVDIFNGADPLTVGCREDLPSNGQLLLDGVLGDWVKDAKAGLGEVIKNATTYWIDEPPPNIGDTNGISSGPVQFLQSSLAWYTGVFLVMSIIFGACMVFWNRDQGASFRNLAKLLLTFVTWAWAGVAIISVCLVAASGFAKWIIEKSLDGTAFGANLYKFFDNDAVIPSSILALGLVLIAMLLSGIQWVLMIFRGASLFLLVGTLPIVASLYITETGQQMLKKHLAWTISFILYLPVAGIIYAAGFRLLGEDTSTPSGSKMAVQGIALLLLAIFALPATMRLVTPAVADMTNGRGVGGTVASSAAFGVAAVGSRALART